MSESTALKREFELERMILFSDAVFAIAVTLLVIDIKFPALEKGESTDMVWRSLRPSIIHFGAFVISFIFIASMWYKHLQLFRFLRTYDTGLVIRNLAFIFFIVCFPFVVSGLTENVGKVFLLPMFIYLGNIALTVFAQFAITRYMLVTKPGLCTTEQDAQKKYLLLQSQYISLCFLATLATCVITYFISGGNPIAFMWSVYLLPVLMFGSRILLKKQKQAAQLEKRKVG